MDSKPVKVMNHSPKKKSLIKGKLAPRAMLSLRIVPHAEGKRREIVSNKKYMKITRQINNDFTAVRCAETKKEKNKEGGK